MKGIFKEYLLFAIEGIEIMGIVVITLGAIKAFAGFIKVTVTKKDYPIKSQFANAMAMGLEFKLASEILKTVIVQSLNEIIILGAIFLLRILMTFVIHWEINNLSD